MIAIQVLERAQQPSAVKPHSRKYNFVYALPVTHGDKLHNKTLQWVQKYKAVFSHAQYFCMDYILFTVALAQFSQQSFNVQNWLSKFFP